MHVVVPVKRFHSAKQRLARSLSPWQRQTLARTMLTDVLDVLRGLQRVDGVIVVSDEPALQTRQLAHGVQTVRSPIPGLNPGLAFALSQLGQRGVARALLLHADLPLADSAELQALIDMPKDVAVTLVPDRHRRGTNAMVLPCVTAPAATLTLHFGVDSLAQHMCGAREHGLPLRVSEMPSLALDIDTLADIDALLVADPNDQRRSTALLRGWRRDSAVSLPSAYRTSAGTASG